MALPRNESYAARLMHAQASIMGPVTSGRLREASDLAVQLVERFPSETHTHFAIGAALLRLENCPITRRYFNTILRRYRHTRFHHKILAFERACHPHWQRQIILQMQAMREIYPQLASHRQIKPQSGSSLDQYCQFLGLACANMYLQLSRPVAQSGAYLSVAVAAQREQRFAMASTYRLALAYEKLLAGDGALLDENISINLAIKHQLSASTLASYGLRLGAVRPAARLIARPDTDLWIGLDLGMHQIFNNRLIVETRTAVDQLYSNHIYATFLQAKGQLSTYVTPRQNVTAAMIVNNKQFARQAVFVQSRQRLLHLVYKHRLTEHHFVTVAVEDSYEQHFMPKPYLASPHTVQGQAVKFAVEITPTRRSWMRLGSMVKWQRLRSADVLSDRHSVQFTVYIMAHL